MHANHVAATHVRPAGVKQMAEADASRKAAWWKDVVEAADTCAKWKMKYAALALLADGIDAGTWDDDAFLVEERLIEPRGIDEGAADLDAREKALAAQSLAEGVATLHAAGFALASLDVELDAYRQPKLHVARLVRTKDDVGERQDLERLAEIVARLAPGTRAADSAQALAAAIEVPAARVASTR